jgi:hypothetical protein
LRRVSGRERHHHALLADPEHDVRRLLAWQDRYNHV